MSERIRKWFIKPDIHWGSPSLSSTETAGSSGTVYEISNQGLERATNSWWTGQLVDVDLESFDESFQRYLEAPSGFYDAVAGSQIGSDGGPPNGRVDGQDDPVLQGPPVEDASVSKCGTYIATRMSCCGLAEICELRTARSPKEALLTMFGMADTDHHNGDINWARLDKKPFSTHTYIFTEVTEHGNKKHTYGQRFAEFITKHELGTVVAGKPHYNPNYPEDSGTTHLITTWIWSPDVDKLWDYLQANRKVSLKDALKAWAERYRYNW